MVVGQLPPYNWPQTQGPILILALNTDRSRRWSRGWMENRSISRFVASSRRRVCSTFQPTKNQTFSVYYVPCNVYTCDFVPRARFFVVLFSQLSGWQSCNADPFRSIGVVYRCFNACSCEISIGLVMYILV